MKIGDKLYCKKNHKYKYFIKNHLYEILNMFNFASKGKFIFYKMSSEKYKSENNNDRDTILMSQNDIDDYFYTINKSRKLKIQKLNENRG